MPVPTLADLAARPELVDQLPGGPMVAALSAQAATLAYRLAMRAACAPMIVADVPDVDEGPERLTLREAAAFLRLSQSSVAKLARTDLALRRCVARTGTRRLLFVRALLVQYARRPVSPGPGAA